MSTSSDLDRTFREKHRKIKHPSKRKYHGGSGWIYLTAKTPDGVYVGYELTLHKGDTNYSPYGMLGAWYKTLRAVKQEAGYFGRYYPDKYDGYTITRIRVDKHGFRVDQEKDADIIKRSYQKPKEQS